MSYIGNTLPANFQSLPAVQRFNGDGSDTTFTLAAQIANDQSILVSVDGVTQDSNAYSVSGTTLTFTAAPSSGTGNIFVNTISPVGSTITHPASDPLSASTGTFSGDVGISTSSPNKSSSSNALTVNTATATNYSALELSSGDTLNWYINANNGNVYDVTAGSRNRIFFTNGSERLRILAAGGLTFNGDTAAANALDDYEEGTWTPTDNSGAGMTLTVWEAFYTKIGRKVYIEIGFLIPTNSSTADVSIGGLPFVAKSGSDNTGGFTIVGTNSGRTDCWIITRGQSHFGSATNSNVGAKNNNYSNKQIKLCGSYTVA